MAQEIVVIKEHLSTLGGLEKYTNVILDALLKKDYKITLLTTSKPNFPNITIKSCKPKGALKFQKIKNFDKWCLATVKELKVPLVLALDRTSFQTHIRLGNGVHLAYLENRKLYEPKFKSFINQINPLHQTILNIEKKAFGSSFLQKILTNSSMVKEEVIKYYNVNENKIEVVHNGVEWEKLSTDFDNWKKNKEKFCKSNNLDAKKFHFLFVGNDFLRKGLKELISALSLIKEDFHLSVVGKDKRLNWFINFTKKLNLEKKVTFFGPRKDINNFYQMADCLVIPSFYDPFANVTIEALAMGLFVISSKFNGGSEILTKETGKIIDNLLDLNSFKESLNLALKKPKSLNSSEEIRNSVKHLDFSNQLSSFIKALTLTLCIVLLVFL